LDIFNIGVGLILMNVNIEFNNILFILVIYMYVFLSFELQWGSVNNHACILCFEIFCKD